MAKKKRQAATSGAQPRTAEGGVASWTAGIAGPLVFLTGLTSVIPAFVEGSTDVGRAAAVLFVAALWLGAWAVGSLRFGKQQWLWLVGLAAVGCTLLASALLAHFPVSQLLGGLGTGMGALQWIALGVIAAGASATRLGARTRGWIAATYIWVVPVAVWGLVEVASGKVVAAGFLNADIFALVLLVWLAPAAGLAATSRARWERWAWVGVLALLATAIAASGARASTGGAVLELALLVALVAPVFVPRLSRVLRTAGFVAAGVISAGMVAVFAILASGASAADRVVGLLGPTAQTRSLIYQGAVQTFAKAPILGAGPDGYQFASQGYIQPALMAIERGGAFVNTTPADPHSVVLRALVGLGVIGCAALCLAVAGWVVAMRGATPPTPQAAALRDSFAIGVAGFAAAAIFAPWPLTLGASPVLAIGLAASGVGSQEPLADVPRLARWSVAVVVAAVFVWVAFAGIVQYGRFMVAVGSADPQARVSALDGAVAAGPWDEESRFQRLWARGTIVEQGSADPAAFHREVDADALVSAYAPFLAEFVRQSLEQATLAHRTDVSWERATLDRAAALAPGIPDVAAERLHLALVVGDRAQIAAALAAAQGAARSDPNFAQYAAQAAAQ